MQLLLRLPRYSVSFAVFPALLFLANTFLISFEIHELHLLSLAGKAKKEKRSEGP